MELIFDWKNFQSFFYSKKRLTQSEANFPIYVITNGNGVVSAFSEGQDFSDWVGATLDEMEAEFSHREIFLFDKTQVDQWMSQSMDLPHFYDQVQYLRTKCQPHQVLRSRQKISEVLTQRHFLLRAISSWWGRLFPSSYGIYVSLDKNPNTSLLLIVQRGKMISFHVPDLSSMIPDRRRVPTDVVKYIAERQLVPVRGLFLTAKEWTEWSESENPWRKIADAIRGDRTKLAPFSWGVTALVMLKAYFNF